MCLAIPAQITAIDEAADSATVALALVDEVLVGDYVLVHVGYALNKISPEEAERTLQLIAEAGESEEDAA
jgi:hydrogenase expression/formation protein HypC